MRKAVGGPAFNPLSLTAEVRNPYPPPHDRVMDGKVRRVLGDSHGLTQFGVNLSEIAPGGVSALRHSHATEDEFVYITEGKPILVTDAGDQILTPGMCACFPAGSGDAHRLENRSDALVRFIEVGTRKTQEKVHYPDANMILHRTADGTRHFTKLDGSPY